MSDRKPKYITAGNVRLPIYKHRDGWRVAYKDGNGAWRYITRKNRDEAETDGRKAAEQIQRGTRNLHNLTDGEKSILQRVLSLGITHSDLDEWQRTKNLYSLELGKVIDEMVKEKTAARGSEGIHLHATARDLRTLPSQDQPINRITVADISEWLNAARARGAGQRRLMNLRDTAVMLFRWARKRGWLPEGVTAPEMTEDIDSGRGKGKARKVTIYTPEEFRTLMQRAPEDWRGFIALGAFAGIRSDEMFPERRLGKDGLQWGDVDREHGVIRVPAHVSKTGHPRIVPIQPNLEVWLKHLSAPAEGSIIKGDHHAAQKRRKTKLKALWKRNGLRHSYGTYRTAQTQDMPKVSMEMGNSVGMIRLHYFEAVTQAKGEEWFAIMPE